MADPAGCPIVLLIDHDVGFLMWLGELFVELGYDAVPALTCRAALEISGKLDLPIAAVVVNPALRGATQILKKLVEMHPAMRVIGIRDSADHAMQAHGVLQRPSSSKPPFRPHWLTKVRTMMADKAVGHNA